MTTTTCRDAGKRRRKLSSLMVLLNSSVPAYVLKRAFKSRLTEPRHDSYIKEADRHPVTRDSSVSYTPWPRSPPTPSLATSPCSSPPSWSSTSTLLLASHTFFPDMYGQDGTKSEE
ncbi:hypothetical protein IW261DRAFT_1591942 [Armillaria novae-zelandiae]|uniref:Uncharacterized protein n=1 Tax=Armillaria novae-zelandiae TaxID=153914 RepID=A0AA39ULN7_9AGAR|nr:hypothetical protein IW261DRAFT_1591942 [Armillaria novae-zelandiae]